VPDYRPLKRDPIANAVWSKLSDYTNQLFSFKDCLPSGLTNVYLDGTGYGHKVVTYKEMEGRSALQNLLYRSALKEDIKVDIEVHPSPPDSSQNLSPP
jgi:hypothetical protein